MSIKFTRRKLPEYKAQAKEVVKVLNDRPHLLVRVEVSGEYFPHRAAEPFIRIKVENGEYFNDLFADISPNNQRILGYLPVNVPACGIIEFGYGAEIWGIVPTEFTAESVMRLKREKLPKDLIVTKG
jgi:hypothetical protein